MRQLLQELGDKGLSRLEKICQKLLHRKMSFWLRKSRRQILAAWWGVVVGEWAEQGGNRGWGRGCLITCATEVLPYSSTVRRCFLGITHSLTELSAQGLTDLVILLQQYFGFIDTYTSMSLEKKKEFQKHSGYITFPLHTKIKQTHCCQANADFWNFKLLWKGRQKKSANRRDCETGTELGGRVLMLLSVRKLQTEKPQIITALCFTTAAGVAVQNEVVHRSCSSQMHFEQSFTGLIFLVTSTNRKLEVT